MSIRDLDDDVKERLRIRAARNGRSMEAEIRAILAEAVSDPRPTQDLFTALLDRVGPTAGAEIDIPPRATRARAADVTA